MSYYLHWDYKTVMGLEHFERGRWCSEVSQINKKLNEDEAEKDLLDI